MVDHQVNLQESWWRRIPIGEGSYRNIAAWRLPPLRRSRRLAGVLMGWSNRSRVAALAARANAGASIATLRLAASAISKAHEWAKLESPCRDPGVRASLKGWGRRLSRPQRQSGALTADVLAVIRLTAVQPRKRGRGFETAEQAAVRARFDLALVSVLSDGGLRRSEASSLTWGDESAGTTAAAASHHDSLQDRRGGLLAPWSPSLPQPWKP